MPQRLFHLYQRKRIVNVNTNVVLAGLAAMVLTLIPLNLSRMYLDGDTLLDKVLITLIAGVFDIAFDVLLYYGLHWVANHWRPKWAASKGRENKAFLHEATVVQIERAILSPLYYIVALGLKLILLKMGVERELAFVIGFVVGIALTRVIHTIWGIRSGRFRDADQQRERDVAASEDTASASGAPEADAPAAESQHDAISDARAERKDELSRHP